MELNERKIRILKSIIDEYIDHGEPVGSKHLMQAGGISLSPATIRNEMSDLEEMGYLDKPHTSAGRVPSSSAYRLYAEELMREYQTSAEKLELLAELTRFQSDEMDKIVGKARKVLSKLTGYASITVSGDSEKSAVERFEALPIDAGSMLLVFVMPDGTVNSKHLAVGARVTDADVARMKGALNLILAGKPLDSVALPEIMQLEEQFGEFRALVNPILRLAYEAADGGGKSVEVDGITNLLAYPEFRSVEKVKDLLGLFEQDGENLRSFLPAERTGFEDGTLRVYVGDENADGETPDASIVFCSLPVGRKNTLFGILGPRRMDYKKATNALTRLTQTLKTLSDKENPENG